MFIIRKIRIIRWQKIIYNTNGKSILLDNKEIVTSHRFLDESGDPTFFKKGRILAIGEPGISLAFSIGMVKFNTSLAAIRAQILAMQDEIVKDKISLVVDLYDIVDCEGGKNLYNREKILTVKNKLSPPLPWEGYPSTTWSRLSGNAGDDNYISIFEKVKRMIK